MRIALIRNGIVENVIEADMDFAQTLGFDAAVEDTDTAVGIGWGYMNGAFVAPPAPPVETPAPVTNMSRLDFLKRFTSDERIAIRASTDPVILDAQEMLGLAEFIDVSDPYTVQYVNYLASNGFITQDRVAQILAPVTP